VNLLRLVLKEDKSGLYFINPPFRIDLPEENFGILKEKGYLGEEIILGIRPEHIKLGDKGRTPPQVCKFKKGEVKATELNLFQLLVYLAVGSQTLVAVLDPFLRLKTGEMLPLNFSLDKTVFFDPITGNVVLYLQHNLLFSHSFRIQALIEGTK